MTKEDIKIKKENERRFLEIEKFRNKTVERVSPQNKKMIENGVKKAWKYYGETFRALSEVD